MYFGTPSYIRFERTVRHEGQGAPRDCAHRRQLGTRSLLRPAAQPGRWSSREATVPDDKLKPPGPSRGDAAHAVARAGLSTIPVVGGAAVELFQHVVQPPLDRRRNNWMEAVGEKLAELEQRGVDIDALKKNERFISTVMHASQLALRTHQKEKLAALRNVIANAARGQSPEEALEHMFLDFIDSLSDLHVRILRLFQAPTPPPNMSMGGLRIVLERNMPELRGRRELYDQFWKDLYSRGLVNTDGLHTTMSGGGLGQKRTTGLGDQFLSFISDTSR